jgi:hypothetical protein
MAIPVGLERILNLVLVPRFGVMVPPGPQRLASP